MRITDVQTPFHSNLRTGFHVISALPKPLPLYSFELKGRKYVPFSVITVITPTHNQALNLSHRENATHVLIYQ